MDSIYVEDEYPNSGSYIKSSFSRNLDELVEKNIWGRYDKSSSYILACVYTQQLVNFTGLTMTNELIWEMYNFLFTSKEYPIRNICEGCNYKFKILSVSTAIKIKSLEYDNISVSFKDIDDSSKGISDKVVFLLKRDIRTLLYKDLWGRDSIYNRVSNSFEYLKKLFAMCEIKVEGSRLLELSYMIETGYKSSKSVILESLEYLGLTSARLYRIVPILDEDDYTSIKCTLSVKLIMWFYPMENDCSEDMEKDTYYYLSFSLNLEDKDIRRCMSTFNGDIVSDNYRSIKDEYVSLVGKTISFLVPKKRPIRFEIKRDGLYYANKLVLTNKEVIFYRNTRYYPDKIRAIVGNNYTKIVKEGIIEYMVGGYISITNSSKIVGGL